MFAHIVESLLHSVEFAWLFFVNAINGAFFLKKYNNNWLQFIVSFPDFIKAGTKEVGEIWGK